MKTPLQNLLRAFQYRNYRTFFLGQSIALIGGWMTMAALGWLLFRLTGDPFKLGLMGFFMHAPTFLLAPLGGLLVDHISRRAVIVCAQAVDMMTISVLAALTLTGVVAVWHIMVVCACLGITKAFEMPARQALVVDLVDDREMLSNAIALNSTIFHGARLIGPMLAGTLIIPLAGEGVCFLLHAICYLFAIRCFVLLRPRKMARNPSGASIFRQLGEGFTYAFGYAPIRALLLLVTAFALLGQSYNTLLPVFAESILEGDSGTYGLLLGATGIGAVIAAIRLASRESIVGMGRVIFLSTILFALSLMAFGLSSELFLSLPLLLIIGFASINVMVGTNTIMQTLVEDHLRGRVMSLLGMVFMGAMPLGALTYGKIAELMSAPGAVLIGAGGCLLAGVIFRCQLPSLQRIVTPLYIERGILPKPEERSGSADFS